MKIQSSCGYCTKAISVTPSQLKNGRGKYCSRECQYKGIHISRTKELVCRYCSVGFRVPKSSTQVICSNTCRYIEQNDPLTEANKTRREAYTGDKSHAWRGGVTTQNRKDRSSSEYRQWRLAVYRRDWFKCQMCGARGNKNGVVLNADHIKPFSKYPELRFDVDNGRTLCVPCHKATPTYGYKAVYA